MVPDKSESKKMEQQQEYLICELSDQKTIISYKAVSENEMFHFIVDNGADVSLYYKAFYDSVELYVSGISYKIIPA